MAAEKDGRLPAADDYDAVLLSQARLGVVAALIGTADRSLSFPALRDVLGLTQGNLGVHLRKLEEAEYIEIEKTFAGNKPQTIATLTAAGRQAFLRHVALLQSIAEGR